MADDELLELELDCDLRAGGETRRALEPLFGTSVRGDESSDVLLLSTELVTNAVRHGSGTPIAVRVGRSATGIRVEVANPGTGGTPEPRDGGPEGGWGLQLVDAIASEWDRRLVDGRTHVWFELQRPRDTLL